MSDEPDRLENHSTRVAPPSIGSTSVLSGSADTVLIDEPSTAIAGLEEQADPHQSCEGEGRDNRGTVGAP